MEKAAITVISVFALSSIYVNADVSTCKIVHLDDIAVKLKTLSGRTNIIQYDLHYENYSRIFWEYIGQNAWIKPTTVFWSKTKITKRYLLLLHFYNGMFESISFMGWQEMTLRLATEPPRCLFGMNRTSIQIMLTKFILTEMNIGSEEDIPDDSVCTVGIIQKEGERIFGYNCGILSPKGKLSFYTVSDDVWIIVLGVMTMIASVLLFLHIPQLLPKSYGAETFAFIPKSKHLLNVMVTRNFGTYDALAETNLAVTLEKFEGMTNFGRLLRRLPLDVVKRLVVSRFDLSVDYDRLLSEDEPPFNMFNFLYHIFVRCRIRQSDAIEECCKTKLCGKWSCRFCPGWEVITATLRTLIFATIVVLPVIPEVMLYVFPSTKSMEYEAIESSITRQRRKRIVNPFNAEIFFSVIGALYVIHILVIIIDSIQNDGESMLAAQMFRIKRESLENKYNTRGIKRILDCAISPVTKYGLIALPIWFLVLILSPFLLICGFLLSTPLAKEIQRLILNTISIKAKASFGQRVKIYMFAFSYIGVLLIFLIGCSFLTHAATVIIINVVINIEFTMHILPVTILILFYIRDTFAQVSMTYMKYHEAIISVLVQQKNEECLEVAKRSVEDQENVVFQSRHVEEESSSSSTSELMPMDEELALEARGLVLFLNKDDMVYVSRKFFNSATKINCKDSPGPYIVSVLKALKELWRIALFLACLGLIVMAYGDISYISPEGQFFATFVTGLIPFALKKFIMKTEDDREFDTENLRFVTELANLERSLRQNWKIDDICVEDPEESPWEESTSITDRHTDSDVLVDIASLKSRADKVDLVVYMPDWCCYGDETQEVEIE